MAIAIDPTKPFKYVLPRERGKPGATTWLLRCLTAGEDAAIQDEMIDPETGKIRIRPGTGALNVLRVGLVGAEDLVDDAGNAVAFRAGDVFIDRIAPEDRRTLANAITDRSRLTEDDRKNSSSAPAL